MLPLSIIMYDLNGMYLDATLYGLNSLTESQ
jgi:hypothetical protein